MQSFNDTERIILARYIAEDNLQHANEVAAKVKVKKTIYGLFFKRLIDILISGLILIITAPINLVIAIITFFDVGSPIIFRQKRIGKDGQEFEIIKFRNMTNATDSLGNLLMPKDRVTKWGKFVRKTSLEELMNFWSIFKGDMSLIGPRPLVSNYLDRYSDRHMKRHAVRPGLECPDLGNIEPSASAWNNQFENDIWYVEHMSFATDIKLLIGLVRLVFDKKATSARANVTKGAFMGYDENGIAMNSTEIPEKYVERLRREYGEDVTKDML